MTRPMPRTDTRYSARLVNRVEETDGRWHAGRNDLEEICRLALERRQKGELAIVTDHETHQHWRVERVGDEIQRVPL